MNQTAAILFAALIGVFGALLGLVVERLLRSAGRLWCVASDWGLKFMSRPNAYGEIVKVPPETALQAEYSFGLDLFNGKEIPVGLRDISVMFACDGGKLEHKPRDVTSRRSTSSGHPTYEILKVVNLPPRQWVHLELVGTVDEVETIMGWRRADFVSQRQRRGLYEGKTYRKTIAIRHPVDHPSWWRRFFGVE